MKDEQKTKIANAIAQKLNITNPQHETENARAAGYIAAALDTLAPTKYYEEANEKDLEFVGYLFAGVAKIDYVAFAPVTVDETKAVSA